MTISRKDAILAAGRALFATRGFDKVTTRQLCAHAELLNGSFYHVYESKDVLAADLYAEACRHRDQHAAAALAAFPQDAERAVKEVVRRLMRFMASENTDVMLLRRLRGAVQDDERFAADPDGLAGLLIVLQPWVDEMIAAKKIVEIAPEIVAALVLGATWTLTGFKQGNRPMAEIMVVEMLADHVWQAVRATPADKAHRPRQRQPVPAKKAPVQPDLL